MSEPFPRETVCRNSYEVNAEDTQGHKFTDQAAGLHMETTRGLPSGQRAFNRPAPPDICIPDIMVSSGDVYLST